MNIAHRILLATFFVVFTAPISAFAEELAPPQESISKQIEEYRESNDFKRMSLLMAIGYQNDIISAAKKDIARQKQIGAESGFVDKQTMYGMGSLIIDTEKKQKTDIAEYRKAGGKTKNLTVGMENISTSTKECVASHNVPKDVAREAIVNAAYIALYGYTLTNINTEDQLNALKELSVCFN